jgi:hypothetical protein
MVTILLLNAAVKTWILVKAFRHALEIHAK